MHRDPPPSNLVVFVAVVVTVVWALSVMVSLLIREYSVLIYTTPIAGAVVGYATGIRLGKDTNGRT